LALAKCPGCAAALPEESNFCPECGRALGDLERPRAAAQGSGWVEFVDKAWDFFASTRVAVVLIALLAVASILGSLVEQEHLYQDWRPPHLYYPDRYGAFWGNLYLRLGLTHAYTSTWYSTLVLMVVVSLIICSFHRLVPLHRMLTRPQVWKLPHFIRRQDVVHEAAGSIDEMEKKLKKRGYKVLRDRECLYADRGRLSRYGPYIIHIGLLLVAFSAVGKAVPAWNQTRDVWIQDGQTVKVPDTDFAITNHKFTMELYTTGMPTRFATDASIIRDGQEVKRQIIEVNKPMSHEGWEVYQTSWREEPGVARVKVTNQGGFPVANLAIDLRQPEQEYRITDQVKMAVVAYYHDFTLDPQTKAPANASFEIRNPVIMADFIDQKGETVGRAALMVMSKESSYFTGPYALTVENVDTRWYTALKLHKDKTVPWMYFGLGVVMLGMMITFFLFHWQVWVREEQGKLLVGARAYKNKFGLKQDLKRLLGIVDGEVATNL
jgi:cytochrome c biogenesis protein